MRTDRGTIIAAVILLAAVFFIGVKNPTGKAISENNPDSYSFEYIEGYIESDGTTKTDDGYVNPGSSPDPAVDSYAQCRDKGIKKGPYTGSHKDKKRAEEKGKDHCLSVAEFSCKFFCAGQNCKYKVGTTSSKVTSQEYNKEEEEWNVNVECSLFCDCY